MGPLRARAANARARARRAGLRLRALETGSGEPVLFMHGITLCAAHWASLMARLDPLRCIVIDMPGHGGSEAVGYPGADLRRWHTTMLRGCLDRLGLDSAYLVGHSYGGMFALWLALDAPKRVRSVVTVGTPSVAFRLNSLTVGGSAR